MKLLTFRHQNRTAAGISTLDGVLDLSTAARQSGETADLTSMLAIIRGGQSALDACKRLEARALQAGAALLPASQIQLLAPIPEPARNVFCVGRNYIDHVKEGASAMSVDLKLPVAPQFFTKATRTVVGSGADVRLDPKVTRRLDYEVELAVIIGRGGRDISAAEAPDYIFGYTIANDVTARDLQRRHEQWFKGKSLDTTLPLGPVIVTRDSIGDPSSLELTMSINGQERQRARVEQMIFNIPAIIESLSAGMTLEAGDIIATGTPSGVGFAMKEPQYLKHGDEMLAGIDRIGELRNRIVEV